MSDTQNPDPDIDYDEPPMGGDPEIFGGMLNSIMANYFEYERPNGQTLNLAELLVLISQSINENTLAIKNHTKAVLETKSHKRT
jgi:hypothetical protein